MVTNIRLSYEGQKAPRPIAGSLVLFSLFLCTYFPNTCYMPPLDVLFKKLVFLQVKWKSSEGVSHLKGGTMWLLCFALLLLANATEASVEGEYL